MKTAAEYIIDRLDVRHVFTFCGGGNMWLVDALVKREGITPIYMHHEGALSYAVNGYALMHDIGVGLVTSGPGSLNAVPGVAEAWAGSIPCLFISGQSVVETCAFSDRQLGVQQCDIVSIVKPITKYAVTIVDIKTVKFHIENALTRMRMGRCGPVWLDIPLDIQNTEMWENDEHPSINESI